MSECWIKIYSVRPWLDSNIWLEFYSQTERILSASLTNLDTNDPAKRKVKRSDLESTGEFTTHFASKEDSRWLFGRFKDANVEMTIRHHKDPRTSDRDVPNSVTIYFPEGYCKSDEGAERIEKIFELGNELLSPFYSFVDLEDVIAKKKKPYGAVNIQEELIGVFWLTFLNNKYVDFFGREKIAAIPEALLNSLGLKLKLGRYPIEVSEAQRAEVEKELGDESFVDTKSSLSKRPGKAVLLFSDLH